MLFSMCTVCSSPVGLTSHFCCPFSALNKTLCTKRLCNHLGSCGSFQWKHFVHTIPNLHRFYLPLPIVLLCLLFPFSFPPFVSLPFYPHYTIGTAKASADIIHQTMNQGGKAELGRAESRKDAQELAMTFIDHFTVSLLKMIQPVNGPL